ncbi:DUF4150 domain-containing protein [Paraburkholderia caballeronis]|uniref:Uncharacterized protein n=1 Tax=Paraburkholderia caballeronis TaxID=416943 RepID=A0A1H7UB94_9BURK|nr:DUF4150 domain-containing protein [Paraburkholderia caballeronis]PXW23301.1 uncharacterized protein DUF4150 [Paraburkholderia caballeronis]PXW98294.1 uncharacterized protein DUF4150 [Paraburkholderia caballeronis]RAJ95024.1 uncharacterized protein DUF4150 [Paraburkholderia caballeronis]TDV28728.1 uncharacterized protein DUF4150 [Paraburkholderia caballeronis]SEC61069.1 protein of unknown function [Paraburkholderia caballeronis]
MFAVTKEAGQCMGMPDVCKTPAPPAPPIPVPYPNIAMPMMGNPVTQKVLIVGVPALTKASEIPMSSGDEPGVAGGLVSSTDMGKLQFSMGSTTVMLEGNPAVRLSAPTQHNGGNAIGAVLVPSQPVVMIMS